ncbi:hypothetical protein CH54_3285 [Yersinia rochesterensis]|uniref:Uncharacterized protein n=1 Tax=Yersinia rochesterensis TaxID=1604335 RepID=A0ABM5SLY7_9GAMM|nr:hypothetical protein AW19_2502 [Yersinia frederiksenii Y225]AJJ35538.1 hypothetical protein CH54_3285 [Yersinia rochesterensis]CRY66999.1 Uncharacterised protein [Yersinia kristensenii]
MMAETTKIISFNINLFLIPNTMTLLNPNLYITLNQLFCYILILLFLYALFTTVRVRITNKYPTKPDRNINVTLRGFVPHHVINIITNTNAIIINENLVFINGENNKASHQCYNGLEHKFLFIPYFSSSLLSIGFPRITGLIE